MQSQDKQSIALGAGAWGMGDSSHVNQAAQTSGLFILACAVRARSCCADDRCFVNKQQRMLFPMYSRTHRKCSKMFAL